MKKRINIAMIGSVTILLFMVLLTGYTMFGIDKFYKNSGKQEASQIKRIIEAEAVECYALEGAYPPDLDYLVKNYGLVLNHDRYYYDYNIFASNVAPQIEVLPIGQERK